MRKEDKKPFGFELSHKDRQFEVLPPELQLRPVNCRDRTHTQLNLSPYLQRFQLWLRWKAFLTLGLIGICCGTVVASKSSRGSGFDSRRVLGFFSSHLSVLNLVPLGNATLLISSWKKMDAQLCSLKQNKLDTSRNRKKTCLGFSIVLFNVTLTPTAASLLGSNNSLSKESSNKYRLVTFLTQHCPLKLRHSLESFID